MFRQHLLLIYRNILRSKSSFFINLIGLSTGLACALLIYLWVNDELNVDRFHENDSRLFQVMANEHHMNGITTGKSTPGPLAKALAEEIPEIEYATHTTWKEDYLLSVADKNIKAAGQYVGKDFFKIFSYPLIQGDENHLQLDKNSMAISEGLAVKLFNTTENVIGKAVEFQHEKEFLISAIFKDLPPNSSHQIAFVLPFEAFTDIHPYVMEWNNSSPHTYVTLKEGTNIKKVNEKIERFIHGKINDSNTTIFLKSYSDNYLYGTYENGVQSGGRIEYVRLFSFIALFMVVIACINFMNLSTAQASRRMKEVGVKKTLGASRQTLVFQYLTESVLMTFLSLFVAICLVELVLPQFNQITEKQLSITFNLYVILSLLGISLLTGIIAGSYPALYLSGFNAARVLKGRIASERFGAGVGEMWARKGLVVFQFTLSIILLVVVLVLYKQMEFAQSKNMGYNKDNIIFFRKEGKLKEEETRQAFLLEAQKIPGVVNASGIAHHLRNSYHTTGSVVWEGKAPDMQVDFESVAVDYEMIETLNIQMKEGRAFSRSYGTDSLKIIFNEAAIELMGISDPIGKVVEVWNEEFQIVGVANNFHFESIYEEVKPAFFMLRPARTWAIMAKIEAGMEKETIAKLQNLYQEFNPGFPFDFQFLDENHQALYESEQRVASLSKYFAGLAILISCLGLFGLAAFTAERRRKEIGVRKALGSSDFSIIFLLSGDFTKLVISAMVIALPISYLLARSWLDGFAYRIDLELWYFVTAGLMALVVAWLTVGMQAIKAARINPVKALKYE